MKKMAKYKKPWSVTLFDAQDTKENLSELGNPLECLSQVVDFEMFRNAMEDVFGFEEGCMNRHAIRNIGFVRAKLKISLANLIYNFCRLEQMTRLGIN